MYMRQKNHKFNFTIGFILLLMLNFTSFSFILAPLHKSINDSNLLNTSGLYYSIVIDDLPGSLTNWAWAETQPWCTGSGTVESPYIIEGHTFEFSTGLACFSILNSRKPFIINNCTIRYSQSIAVGLSLENVTNGQILNSHIHNHSADGIVLLDASEIFISNNEIYNNSWSGILVYLNCENITVTGNTIHDNGWYGVEVLSDNNLFYNNSFTNPGLGHANDIGFFNSWNNSVLGNYWDDYSGYDMDFDGIGDDPYDVPPAGMSQDYLPIWSIQGPIAIDDLPGSLNDWSWAASQSWCRGSGTELDPYIIENLNLDGNNIDSCISIKNSEKYFTINGCIVYNAGPSQTDAGIYLNNVTNGNLIQNDCSNNGYVGIHLNGSNNNLISRNSVNNNAIHGIAVWANCEENIILGNTINKNTQDGVHIVNSHNNTISQNTIKDNFHNDMSGLYLSNSLDNTINENTFHNNYYGIDLYLSDYNVIYENVFTVNNRCGIYIDEGDGGSHNNLAYHNFFINNVIHAIDDEPTNNWNNSYIGNYWDNHTGPDENPQDGIVDKPYNITGKAGSKDFLPIAEDGPPIITINSPSDDDVFGTKSPTFTISITDSNLDSIWYTLDGGITNFTSTTNGTIDQTAWSALSQGNVTITFYASDIPGNIGSAEVYIEKDAVAPLIIINSPSTGDKFGINAPAFNITVIDDRLDSVWYSLDGGLTNFIITTNGTIKQTAWSALSQGNITITFYANDTLGNLAAENLNVEKTLPVSGINFIIIIITISIVSGAAITTLVVVIFLKKRKPGEEVPI
ncbi:MAG: right-handed parallel beta-helix repeat-containing protein [Candidatus Lokiarchaeota archaeon]|nr:right-handed parallel beta-helix repeat-containing protein [Candidatus Lokiarchaeota archaeon]